MDQEKIDHSCFDHFSEVSEEDYEVTSAFKIIFLGDSGVGKTNIMKRFSDDMFDFYSKPTIGVDFRTKVIKIKDHIIKLQIWDTAGQERYKSFTKAYFKDCKGILMVYDVTNMSTLNGIDTWLDLAKEHSKIDNLPMVLVGNKTDLDDEIVVEESTGREYAETHGMEFIETSAYENEDDNIGKAFYMLMIQIINHPELFPKTIEKAKIYKKRKSEGFTLPNYLKTDSDQNNEEDKKLQNKETEKRGCC